MDPMTTTHTSASLLSRHVLGHEPFLQELTGQRPQTRWLPSPRPTLCASLRNRNAHGHVTRNLFIRTFTSRMPQTKVGRQTLRKPAHLKSTWTCDYRAKLTMRKLIGKKHGPCPRGGGSCGHWNMLFIIPGT